MAGKNNLSSGETNGEQLDLSLSIEPRNGSPSWSSGCITRDILESLREGDHSAFDIVFHAYYGRVKVFITMLTKSSDDAEDIAQQTFVKLWETRESIDTRKNFNAFMFTVAKNNALNFIKKSRTLDSIDVSPWDRQSDASTDSEILTNEIQLLVKLSVNAMPSQRRRIFEMSRIDNRTNKEIAEVLGITLKAVEKHLRLALQDIHKIIKTY